MNTKKTWPNGIWKKTPYKQKPMNYKTRLISNQINKFILLFFQKNVNLFLINRLERKKDGLLRENERLKNDSRTSRKSMNLYCNT